MHGIIGVRLIILGIIGKLVKDIILGNTGIFVKDILLGMFIGEKLINEGIFTGPKEIILGIGGIKLIIDGTFIKILGIDGKLGTLIQGKTIGGILMLPTGILGFGIEKLGNAGQAGIVKFKVCCCCAILGSDGFALCKAVCTVVHLGDTTVTTGSILEDKAYVFLPDKTLVVLSPSPKSILNDE